MSLPAFVEPLDQGLYAIDTGFHRDRFDAAYLMVQDGRAAFIDTGTNFSVPRLLAALDAVGLPRDAVDWVIPTHVHLDHAGGVGLLMSELPRARALVHPRGARHMVDPTALYQGALAVYGQQEMDRAYGHLVPVPAERVVSSAEGMTVELAGRPLTLIDTPGHARHHHCIWDESTRGWFTGDTFGLSYREFDIEPEFREEWDKFDLWRFKSVLTEPIERAYSMANYPLEKGTLLEGFLMRRGRERFSALLEQVPLERVSR